MGPTFVHLHLHTQYSLLDGAILLADLFPAIKERGMDAVAITDHGNMYGAVHFFKSARAAQVKPIFGSEVYVAEKDMEDKTNRVTYHLVLLARNPEGYKNLQYLVSMANLKGFYYHPRIDLRLLKERSAGLIGLSACLSGHVTRTLQHKGRAAARKVARAYKEIFEPGMYFLELQANGMAAQDEANEELVRLAGELDIPLVATNDCHYVDRKHALAQEVLMCIQQGRTLQDEKRIRHESDDYYIKTPAEMERAFRHVPQAIENTLRIASMCDVKLELQHTQLPNFKVPEGFDQPGYLRHLARLNLDERLSELRRMGRTVDDETYRGRLERELDLIASEGFAGYFLIVWDFIRDARQKGIPVGPGRGSGAGSLVAYALRITDLDPLVHGLLFERFLNPERVSMPDFDIDFCRDRRDEVLHYVVNRYGKANVGQIVTYSTLKARGVVRDVARVLGMPYAEADAVAKLVPEGPMVTLSAAMETEPRLKEIYKKETKYTQLLDLARSLEGLHRHAGMHAAGVVISEHPLWETVPCGRAQEGVVEVVTQFAKNEVEEVGLVKFDFLGLKTLTIIAETLKRINTSRSVEGRGPFVLEEIPTDDEATYRMLQQGLTAGVFQMESPGFTDLVKRLRPDRFSDLVAAVALYRPGPLQGGMVDDFIARKHGRQIVRYLHPALETLLQETYGVLVYQEQVMQCASVLAGFSLGEADLMRRAMGKKKPEEMQRLRTRFVDGASKKKVNEGRANEIFDLMEQFAGYGFNKSHSAAYAMIAYRTAYLKCHYPVEYVAGVLTCEKDDSDNVTKYMNMARQMGVTILPPDINESDIYFSVVRRPDKTKAVRFGLGAVKRVGEAAVEAILSARKEGPFTSLTDLCQRVDLKKVNRGVLESLIKAGALDTVAASEQVHRAQLLAGLDQAIEEGQRAQWERQTGQTSLFGRLDVSKRETMQRREYPDIEPWGHIEQLSHEKESLGFYISGHPLERFRDDVKRFGTHPTDALESLEPSRSQNVSVAGVVADYKERPTKSGNGRMANFSLEDLNGRVEVLVFPKDFEAASAILPTDEPVVVTGQIRREEGKKSRLFLREIRLLSQLRLQRTTRLHLRLTAAQVSRSRLQELKTLLSQHAGRCAVTVHVILPDQCETIIELPDDLKVSPTDELLTRTEHLFGADVVTLV